MENKESVLLSSSPSSCHFPSLCVFVCVWESTSAWVHAWGTQPIYCIKPTSETWRTAHTDGGEGGGVGGTDTKAELHRERQSAVLQCRMTGASSRLWWEWFSQMEESDALWQNSRCRREATQAPCCLHINNSVKQFERCQLACCAKDSTKQTQTLAVEQRCSVSCTHLEWRWSGLTAGSPVWEREREGDGESREKTDKEIVEC